MKRKYRNTNCNLEKYDEGAKGMGGGRGGVGCRLVRRLEVSREERTVMLCIDPSKVQAIPIRRNEYDFFV